VRRTIVIGDLQGCFAETVALLEKCEATNEDRVIFAGDLIDRGPENGLCVDLAMARERVQGTPAAVLGNHERKHLDYRDVDEQGGTPNVVADSHVRTRKQLRAEHYEYMRRMPLYIRLPEHNAVVVHAGVFPGVPLEEQDERHLLHIQMINPSEGKKTMWPSKAPPDWKFWTHFYDGPERVIFGHSVLSEPLVTDKVVGIDGGACFGLSLHALILPEWRIVSVKATVDHGVGKRGRGSDGGREIKTFNIHGNVFTYS